MEDFYLLCFPPRVINKLNTLLLKAAEVISARCPKAGSLLRLQCYLGSYFDFCLGRAQERAGGVAWGGAGAC